MLTALEQHWQEYLIEAWCLGTFMVSACAFAVLLFHPASHAATLDAGLRMVLMGLAMGLTAVAIICSPWGKRSGAHFNPAVTLTFLRLGKIKPVDAAFYIVAQFLGGAIGVLAAWLLLGDLLAEPSVNFVATVPGGYGIGAAFAVEVIISFSMMTMILFTSNSTRTSHLTPYAAGSLLALFIALGAPISGTSLNPARTAASALVSGTWSGWWIYFAGPTIAMLAAGEFFARARGLKAVMCAKLRHGSRMNCIFNCELCPSTAGSLRMQRVPGIY